MLSDRVLTRAPAPVRDELGHPRDRCQPRGQAGGHRTLWELEALKQVAQFRTDHHIMACAFSSYGQSIATGDEWGVVYFLRVRAVAARWRRETWEDGKQLTVATARGCYDGRR